VISDDDDVGAGFCDTNELRSKEEALEPDVALLLTLTLDPEVFTEPLETEILSCWGFGCVTIVSLIESIEFCEGTRFCPARCCFFFFAKSYMSPNMPANVLRRFFIVSSASSTTDDCC
jgi:hypothetical protein